jgi:cytochrome c2
MKTKVFYVIALMGFGVVSCSGSNNEGQANVEAEQVEEVQYDPVLGVGDFMDFKVEEGLNSELALKGKGLYDSKCASCHSLKNDVIVGPGWSGVTERRQLGWLMNMMTNTTEMLEKDPELKKQIEKYKVQMPELSTSDEDARAILEYMRQNDGAK